MSLELLRAVIVDISKAVYIPKNEGLPSAQGIFSVWTASEMALGEYETPGDIWSLGVIGYQMLRPGFSHMAS